jgi:5'-nucleotidase
MFQKLSLLLILALCSSAVQAELLRILHTNDLHAHLIGVQDELKLGGYAQLKKTMDKITEASNQQGIPVLRLDAGDFSEGSLAYKANDGLNVFQLMEMLKYDAVALGNHDYLMGPKRFSEILKSTDVPLVAANIDIKKKEQVMRQKLRPYRMIQKGNLKIAVIGGTTADVFYRWALKHSVEFNAAPKAINHVAYKLKEESDLTLALTHLGIEEDKKVIAAGKDLDLVVGGHTHTKLDEPVYQENKKRNSIAIVQAGEHGKYVGEILIDVDKNTDHGKRVKVISYKLHPVAQSGEEDQLIKEKIVETKEILNDIYGYNFLHEPLAMTTFPFESKPEKGVPYWSQFFTDAIREEVDAEISINNYAFMGPTQAAGAVTREKIMSFFPRFFDLSNKDGWTIYTALVKGSMVKQMVKLSVSLGYPFLLSGMSYEVGLDNQGKPRARHFRINGKDLDATRKYKVAIPEGYYLGISALSPMITKLILNNVEDTQLSVWKAVEEKLRRSH